MHINSTHWIVNFHFLGELDAIYTYTDFTFFFIGAKCYTCASMHHLLPIENFLSRICTHVGSVDCWWPPQCEASVWDLVETRALCIGQFLVLHWLLKAAGLLPKQTFPRREVGPFKKCVLQDSFYSTQGLDHVCPVVVQIPQFAIMALMSPPERVLFQNLLAKKLNSWISNPFPAELLHLNPMPSGLNQRI